MVTSHWSGRQKERKGNKQLKKKQLTPEVQFIPIWSPTWYLVGWVGDILFCLTVAFPPVPGTNDTGAMSWNDNYEQVAEL